MNVFVEKMKQSVVKGKLGHVVKILVCRKVDSKTLSNIIPFLRSCKYTNNCQYLFDFYW